MARHETKEENENKWLGSLYAALLFLIIANPLTYKLVNSITRLIGIQIVEKGTGCPNIIGLLLHAVVFGLLTRAVMEIPKIKHTTQ